MLCILYNIVYKVSRFQTNATVNFLLFVFVIVLMMAVVVTPKSS